MLPSRIRVFAKPADLAQAAADYVVDVARSAIRDRGSFSIGLAGGNTPRGLYRLLSDEPYVSQIDWDNVNVFFTDERCVPPEDSQSNFRMASESLLDIAPIPPANIHRMRGEIDPATAAKEYGQLLGERFADGGLDLALLGMGEDGHTASLFPGTTALSETHHRCVATYVEKLNAWRITTTFPFLNRSGRILLLVTGASKAKCVQHVLESGDDSGLLPVQLLNPVSERPTWFLDAAAAAME